MKFFSKSKRYIKEEDKVYCDILRLARVSDPINYDNKAKELAIQTLNNLPAYAKIHQRLMPLLHAKAKQLDIFEKLNTQIQNILIKETQQGVITELAKHKQLKQLIYALSSQNVPIVLLKGAAFTSSIYSNSAPRTSNDLDILVKKSDWEKAVKIISEGMNYVEKSRPDVFGDLFELSFKPKQSIGAALDLHWSLTYPKLFTLNERSLWHQSVEHPNFNNKNVRMLSPEHALAHQAIHAYKDMNFCKYNLVDSHEVITQQKPNIAQTLKIVNGWGASVALYQLLNNCQKIMNTNIDINVIEKAKPNFIRKYFVTWLLNSRFNQPHGDKKAFRYRINQLISQFVFTGSVFRPLSFQWLFIKSLIKRDKRSTENVFSVR